MSHNCNLFEALVEGSTTDGNPYNTVLKLTGFVVLSTFIVSTATKNYSQVDKIWSVVPVIYAWIPVCDTRTLLMATISTIWGLRLTWNFNRRGGYGWPPWSGDEDYRWAEIRKGNLMRLLTHPIAWLVFNFGFISLYQNALLLFISYPSYIAYTVATVCETRSLGLIDWVAAALCAFFIYIESIADNQQYVFQTEKCKKKNAGEILSGEFADGFIQSGLFAYVRKPNYAAEQAIWISFYLFTIGATGRVWNWSAVGSILLCLLFQLSGWFTESLTISKYPKYQEYRKQVPLYIPNFFTRSMQNQRPKST